MTLCCSRGSSFRDDNSRGSFSDRGSFNDRSQDRGDRRGYGAGFEQEERRGSFRDRGRSDYGQFSCGQPPGHSQKVCQEYKSWTAMLAVLALHFMRVPKKYTAKLSRSFCPVSLQMAAPFQSAGFAAMMLHTVPASTYRYYSVAYVCWSDRLCGFCRWLQWCP